MQRLCLAFNGFQTHSSHSSRTQLVACMHAGTQPHISTHIHISTRPSHFHPQQPRTPPPPIHHPFLWTDFPTHVATTRSRRRRWWRSPWRRSSTASGRSTSRTRTSSKKSFMSPLRKLLRCALSSRFRGLSSVTQSNLRWQIGTPLRGSDVDHNYFRILMPFWIWFFGIWIPNIPRFCIFNFLVVPMCLNAGEPQYIQACCAGFGLNDLKILATFKIIWIPVFFTSHSWLPTFFPRQYLSLANNSMSVKRCFPVSLEIANDFLV